jgi:hypothetical protein
MRIRIQPLRRSCTGLVFSLEGVRKEVVVVTLLEKTAEVLYLTKTVFEDDPAPWNTVPVDVRLDYERLAMAALTVAYREPVTA